MSVTTATLPDISPPPPSTDSSKNFSLKFAKMDHVLYNLKSYLQLKKSPQNIRTQNNNNQTPPKSSSSPRHTNGITNGTTNGLAANGTVNKHWNEADRVDYEEVEEIATFLRTKTQVQPQIGIICGSGLGGLADLIEKPEVFEYKDIPHFPVSTVAGHKGALVFGNLNGVPVVCMKGRIHPYEGYSLTRCTLPIRVMKLLGVQTLIVTNAAGGLNASFKVADIMIIRDHIFFPGFSGNNPLRGPNDERFGPRFPPMNRCYDRKLMQLAEKTATELNIDQYMRKGVYVMLGGPNYETVAEANFLHKFGADAVGMSTVHEVIVATHCGMRVLGFSLITNKVIIDYENDEEANHEEVLQAAADRAKDFQQLIQNIVKQIGADEDEHVGGEENQVKLTNGN